MKTGRQRDRKWGEQLGNSGSHVTEAGDDGCSSSGDSERGGIRRVSGDD